METLTLQKRETLTGEELQERFFDILDEVMDPDSWLHEKFYGEFGITPNSLTPGPIMPDGSQSYLKDETNHSLDIEGATYTATSFKRRGAFLATLIEVRDNPDLKKLVTASHGNHGIGLAMAGKALGVPVEIHAPHGLHHVKRSELEALGAIVVTDNYESFEDAMYGAELEAEINPGESVLIHPYEQVAVIAGQATVGLEILQDLLVMERAGTIDLHSTTIDLTVAVAGGGLISGIAMVFERARSGQKSLIGPNIRVIGTQMDKCDAVIREMEDIAVGGMGIACFAPGELDESCDSTAVLSSGKNTANILRNVLFVQGYERVSKLATAESMLLLQNLMGKPVEPAGSLAQAANRQRAELGERADMRISVVCGATVTNEITGEYMDLLREGSPQQHQTPADAARRFEELSRAYGDRKVRGVDEVLDRHSAEDPGSYGSISDLTSSVWSALKLRKF